MKWFRSMRLATMILFIGGAAVAQTVRWAPEADYGPFVYADKDGTIKGLSVDFLQLIEKKSTLRFQADPARPLSLNLEAVKRGDTDVLTSLRPTAEREAFLGFTTPYISVPAVLATINAEPDLRKMDGQRIGVGKGYAVEGFVRQHYPKVVWVTFPDDGQALQAMRRGELAGMVADIAGLYFIAGQAGGTLPRLSADIGFQYPLSLAWRKDRPELGKALQDGLNAIGPLEREALVNRWMPPPVRADGGRQLWALVGVAVPIILIVAVWLGRRNRQGKVS